MDELTPTGLDVEALKNAMEARVSEKTLGMRKERIHKVPMNESVLNAARKSEKVQEFISQCSNGLMVMNSTGQIDTGSLLRMFAESFIEFGVTSALAFRGGHELEVLVGLKGESHEVVKNRKRRRAPKRGPIADGGLNQAA